MINFYVGGRSCGVCSNNIGALGYTCAFGGPGSRRHVVSACSARRKFSHQQRRLPGPPLKPRGNGDFPAKIQWSPRPIAWPLQIIFVFLIITSSPRDRRGQRCALNERTWPWRARDSHPSCACPRRLGVRIAVLVPVKLEARSACAWEHGARSASICGGRCAVGSICGSSCADLLQRNQR